VSAPVYLDYNATARVRPEVVEAMARTLASVGNPSSIHAAGRAARNLVETARADVAALVGAVAGAITFVSGGTEGNALGIQSAIADGAERLIIGATEHEAVRETASASGLPIDIWPVGVDGVADLDWLAGALADGPRALVCLMLANNETGVIQPVAQAAMLVREAGGWLHVDAVQAAGKIPVNFAAVGADTLVVAAHKFGGPQGIGAVIANPRITLARQLHGGGQERGRRSGTENVPAIAGFGVAARTALYELPILAAHAAWRDALGARVEGIGAVLLGAAAPRLPQTLCFAAPGFSSDLQVMNLDLAGVMISAGAACSSGKVRPSRVVEAMGHADLATSSVRVSGGWASTEQDWIHCGDVWLDANARQIARYRRVA
jgi:cysteine desulfurase